MSTRSASIVRNTEETQIALRLDLDGTGAHRLATGLPFFDHMLAQVARHGVVDLQIEASGDRDVDAHHTVEDTAICFGEALRQALGDKAGIRRFGEAHLLGRVGEPEEVAEMVAFLASDRAAFSTGGDYLVDGGLMAGVGVK